MSVTLKYDRDIDRVVTVERLSAHGYKNYKRNKRAAERSRFWRREDFYKRTVLDLGCSYGGTMVEAAAMEARVHGVELCEDAVKSCHEQRLYVTHGDLNDPTLWRRLEPVDTVMMLAVWRTSPFTERTSLMSWAWRLCERCLYWETHLHESPVEVAHLALYHTSCTTITVLGSYEDDGEDRYLLRLSNDEPSSDATIVRGPRPIFGTFKELHLSCQ